MFRLLVLVLATVLISPTTVNVQVLHPEPSGMTSEEYEDIRNLLVTIDTQPFPISPSDKNSFTMCVVHNVDIM